MQFMCIQIVLNRPRAELLTPLGRDGQHTQQPQSRGVLRLFVFSVSDEDNKVILCSSHPSEEGPKPGLARREKAFGATQ